MAAVTEDRREAVRRRLREDFEFYPERALRIVDALGDEVDFRLKRPQRRMVRRLMAQRAAGEPMRAIVLKARKVGFSTLTQALLVQRATQIAHHHAKVVAQDNTTAGDIYLIGRFMWANLPDEIKPELAYERNNLGQKYMQFGEPSLLARRAGELGLNSRISVDTARETDAGRGLTVRSLHLSEVAFWPVALTHQTRRGSKKLALLNAVPDDPDTLIVVESTPNGHNHFKVDWDNAVAGDSAYMPIFTPWFEEAGYRRRFLSSDERRDFESSVGEHLFGEDEVDLTQLIPQSYREWKREWGSEWDGPRSDRQIWDATLEHLNWRRWAIASKTEGDVEKFHQEYPSTPEESFLSTGRKVFRAVHVRRVLRAVEETDGRAVKGAFRGADIRAIRSERGTVVDVPQRAVWVPARQLDAAKGEVARWRIWQPPVKAHVTGAGKRVAAGEYVVGVDTMSGEEHDGELAEHAITVIDHRTFRQVAEYASRDDPDQVALEVLLCALHFNRAMVAVEITGGWGMPIVRALARVYRYPRQFKRQVPNTSTPRHLERIGWSTDSQSKPDMEARTAELLREGHDGIVSRSLALQLTTYVRDTRGRTGPEPGKLSDRLLSWMVAQKVAQMTPIRPDRPKGATRYNGRQGKRYGRVSA